MLYEVCLEFGLNPDFEKEMEGQTPDLTLKIANQTFVADVFLTNRPTTTLLGCSGYRDSWKVTKGAFQEEQRFSSAMMRAVNDPSCPFGELPIRQRFLQFLHRISPFHYGAVSELEFFKVHERMGQNDGSSAALRVILDPKQQR